MPWEEIHWLHSMSGDMTQEGTYSESLLRAHPVQNVKAWALVACRVRGACGTGHIGRGHWLHAESEEHVAQDTLGGGGGRHCCVHTEHSMSRGAVPLGAIAVCTPSTACPGEQCHGKGHIGGHCCVHTEHSMSRGAVS